jgi:hypothetical protein
MERVKNRWSESNPNGTQPRAGGTINNADSYNADFWIQDASFLRLKNMELGYTLPRNWYKKLAIQNCRVFASGYNLLSFSQIKILDPETSSSDGSYYPQLRIFNFGVNVTF